MTVGACHDPLAASALGRLRQGDGAGALAMLEAARDAESLPEPGIAGVRLAALGMAHLASGDARAALRALRAAADADETAPVTVLNLALAEARAGDRARARDLMEALDRRHAGWAEPPLRLAELLRGEGQLLAAIAAYERALDRDPARPEALLGLAGLLLLGGEPLRAQTLLVRCCALEPGSWQAWDALGMALMATGEHEAEAAFFKARGLAPAETALALRAAAASHAAGHAEMELARHEVACAADPLDTAAHAARGGLLVLLGRGDEAVDAFEIAAALAPDDPVLARSFAEALLRAGRKTEAELAFRRAIALDPDDAGLRGNHAASLTRLHRYREARDVLESLIFEQGETVGPLCNLTGALVCLGEHAAGLSAARRATVLAPGSFPAWRSLANAAAYAHETTGAALSALMRRTASSAPRGTVPAWSTPATCRPDPDRRLRVGLLSTALRTHPVGWLTLAGFEMLDRDAFDLVCIGQAESTDLMQRRFRAASAEWHTVADPDRISAVAALARSLSLDVLIDLGGYGDQGLLAACAERLAPVQVKWVGMQNHTTGMAEIDWFITDRWETPPALAHLYSERLLTLPDGYVCYSPPANAPLVAPLPALRRGTVTFGCFNNFAKASALGVALWCEVLRDVPDSRLILKAHTFADRQSADAARARFAAHGIAPGRVELRGPSPHHVLLGDYAEIDIVLDPHPYSGGLTTCEALWMGVPVVTLPGETFCSRHSTSHLSNVGLSDWVAASPDDYRALARTRAADLAGLSALRAGLRARVKASPLCDARRFGHNLGAALREAWRDWCGQITWAANPAGE